MNRRLLHILAVLCLTLTMAAVAPVQGEVSTASKTAEKMPMSKMMGHAPGGQSPCGMAASGPCGGIGPAPSLANRLEMMTCILSGRLPMNPEGMQSMMDRAFFLDRVDALGLDASQVARLKEIRNACRADNLRSGADLKIVRLELEEALQGEWQLEGVEPLLQRLHRIESEIQIRHLRALEEARSVLSADQRSQAATSAETDLEELFR